MYINNLGFWGEQYPPQLEKNLKIINEKSKFLSYSILHFSILPSFGGGTLEFSLHLSILFFGFGGGRPPPQSVTIQQELYRQHFKVMTIS